MAVKKEKTKITKAEKPQKKVYTSGTMVQKATGRYSIGDISESRKENRPAGHGKTAAPGKVTVARGTEKPKAAQRGVGQESIDGFINTRTRKKRRG